MIGKTFTNLTVAKKTDIRKNGSIVWECICKCGNKTFVSTRDLNSENTKSCGCLSSRNTIGERSTTHGMRHTRQYNIWTMMKARCEKEYSPSYKNYGAKGIVVEWESFEEFWNDMGGTYESKLTIDRIDNNKNYCKDNCRWVERAEQNRNKSDNIMVTYKGETLPLKTMCNKHGKNYKKVYYRYKYAKWSIIDSLERR